MNCLIRLGCNITLLLGSLSMGLVCLGGCENKYGMAPVTGKVTCNGQPVVGGLITFQPIDAPEKTGRPAGQAGIASSATIGEDGTFTLASIDSKLGAGAVIGPHQVIFLLPPTTRPQLKPDEREVLPPDEIKQIEADFAKQRVYPPCPCSAAIQPGEVEVKAGNNEFEFKLPPK